MCEYHLWNCILNSIIIIIIIIYNFLPYLLDEEIKYPHGHPHNPLSDSTYCHTSVCITIWLFSPFIDISTVWSHILENYGKLVFPNYLYCLETTLITTTLWFDFLLNWYLVWSDYVITDQPFYYFVWPTEVCKLMLSPENLKVLSHHAKCRQGVGLLLTDFFHTHSKVNCEKSVQLYVKTFGSPVK